MKPRRRPLKPVALLLLLLGLSLGGWGLLSAVFPELVPAWLAGLWEQGGVGEKGAGTEGRNGSDGAGTEAAKTADAKKGEGGGLEEGRYFDPKALPKGLTSIDGEGGTGLNRAVKKNGVWFPVYSPGPNPGNGPPPLTVIPLSIASGSPLPGRVNQTFVYQTEAIGGTPPYNWNAVLPAPAGTFNLGPADGLLTGLSKEPLTLTLDLTVTDAAGAMDTASMKLVIHPEKDLMIDTPEMPVMVLGLMPHFRFTASGGVPPYKWLNLFPQHGVTLYQDGPNGGAMECPPLDAGEFVFKVTVMDAQGTKVEKDFLMRVVDQVEITTPSNLPVAIPGVPYRGAFSATGGTPPYTWEQIRGSSFPDSSWKLSPGGILTSPGSAASQLAEFSLLVTDAAGATYEKRFRLPVSIPLILVPSREKVGVAWQTGAVSSLLAPGGTAAAGYRVLRDGIPVFEGSHNNFVDHGVPTGSTPRYTLVALTTDGDEVEIAVNETAVLPLVLARAEPGRNGDPFADRAVSFHPLSAGGYGASSVPRNVTGPPDGRSTYSPAYKPGEVLSLHARAGAGGSVELEFVDNIVEIAPGEDLTVFENVLFVGGNGNQRFMEPAVISVALFPGEWHRLPCDVVPPAAGQPLDLTDPFYYARGIAGRNGTTGSDPTNPNASGGDSFDLDEGAARAGLSWIRFIKIQSTGDAAMNDDAGGDLIRHTDDPAFNPLSGSGSSGFDLDAVSAVHY